MQTETQIQLLNKQAMENLRFENYEIVLSCLNKAKDLLQKTKTKNTSKLQAITFNNFGCYYKAIGQHETALSYLFKSLIIEATPDFDTSILAGTHLNICAIFSLIGNHSKALTHAITALKLLKQSLNNNNAKNITTLIIALHNTGIEYESLGNIEKAASTFKYGLELAQQYLGNKHQFTTQLLKSFLAVTTTEKKYYFEKAKNKQKLNSKKPNKNLTIGLPKVFKVVSQESSPTNRATAKKTFRSSMQTAEDFSNRQELPVIEKPHTFGGRLKKSAHSQYVDSLENKINFLQSQLIGFEKRYKDLEEITGINKSRRLSFMENGKSEGNA